MIKGGNKTKGKRKESQDRGYMEKHGKKKKKNEMTNDAKAAYHG